MAAVLGLEKVQNKLTSGLGFLKFSKNRQRTASSGKVI
jgi:hypothetical protein